MNDEDRIVRIEQVDYLQKSPSDALAFHENFFVLDFLWEGRLGTANNHLRLLRIDAMLGDVFNIPVVPAKLHRLRPYCTRFCTPMPLRSTQVRNEMAYASPFAISACIFASGSTPTDKRTRPSVMLWRLRSAGLT